MYTRVLPIYFLSPVENRFRQTKFSENLTKPSRQSGTNEESRRKTRNVIKKVGLLYDRINLFSRGIIKHRYSSGRPFYDSLSHMIQEWHESGYWSKSAHRVNLTTKSCRYIERVSSPFVRFIFNQAEFLQSHYRY